MTDEHEVGTIHDVKDYFRIGRNAAYDLLEKVSLESVPWARKVGGQWRVDLAGMRSHIMGGELCQVTEKTRGPAYTSPTFATSGAVVRRSGPRTSESPQSVSVSSNWRAVCPAPTR